MESIGLTAKKKHPSLLPDLLIETLGEVEGPHSIYLGAYGSIFTQNGIQMGRVVHTSVFGVYLAPSIENKSDSFLGIKYELRKDLFLPAFIANGTIISIGLVTRDEEEGMRFLEEQVRAAEQRRKLNTVEREIAWREAEEKSTLLRTQRPEFILVEGYQSKRT